MNVNVLGQVGLKMLCHRSVLFAESIVYFI